MAIDNRSDTREGAVLLPVSTTQVAANQSSFFPLASGVSPVLATHLAHLSHSQNAALTARDAERARVHV